MTGSATARLGIGAGRVRNAAPADIAMKRILIVEDNEMNRDVLSRRLARRGYDVLLAHGRPARPRDGAARTART